ncbi:hypothetical protein LJC08_01710 [Methanimicrococcus sp. OttesenSCG-928-J09]|nr:hypothetical protein [Methanimicrococcus sp. OttesenSCG-928-J09]
MPAATACMFPVSVRNWAVVAAWSQVLVSTWSQVLVCSGRAVFMKNRLRDFCGCRRYYNTVPETTLYLLRHRRRARAASIFKNRKKQSSFFQK